MVFSTREFCLTTSEYLGIKFGLIARKHALYWVCLLILGKVVQLLSFEQAFSAGLSMMLLSVLMPIYFWFSTYFDALSSLNASYFQPRRITCDEDGIFIQVREGNSNVLSWTSIVYATKIFSHYVLFLTKDSFIPIPQDVFLSQLDKMDFDYLLNMQKFGMKSLVQNRSSNTQNK